MVFPLQVRKQYSQAYSCPYQQVQTVYLMSSKLMKQWQLSNKPWAAWTCSVGRTTASEIYQLAGYHTGTCNHYMGFGPRSSAGNPWSL